VWASGRCSREIMTLKALIARVQAAKSEAW
jgi:hypothetical protein